MVGAVLFVIGVLLREAEGVGPELVGAVLFVIGVLLRLSFKG